MHLINRFSAIVVALLLSCGSIECKVMKICPEGRTMLSPVRLRSIPSSPNGRYPNEADELKILVSEKYAEAPKAKHEFTGNVFYRTLYNSLFVRLDESGLWFELNNDDPSFKSEDVEYAFTKGRLVWGIDETEGSEHSLDGRRFPLELQLYHYPRTGGRIETDKENNSRLLIVSRFFELNDDHLDGDKALDTLINGAQKVKHTSARTKVVGSLELVKLFPTDSRSDIFSYTGSETIYPCDKAKWLLFKDVGHVSKWQLSQLHDLNVRMIKVPLIKLEPESIQFLQNDENHVVNWNFDTELHEVDGNTAWEFIRLHRPSVLLGLLIFCLLLYMVWTHACIFKKKPKNLIPIYSNVPYRGLDQG